MLNYEKLRQKENYFDFVNALDHELFQIFVPGTDFDPVFSQVLELAGYKPSDLTTPSSFIGRHVQEHCVAMARHFISLIYNVKRRLRNEDVPLENKTKMIDQFLGEFGSVKDVYFTPDLVHLSGPEEVEKARIAFVKAAHLVKNGDYGSTIYNGIIDLLNIVTNSLKKVESGEFVSTDFLDMVDIALFDTSEPILELMGEDKYQHHTYNMPIWTDILNTSPYLLWLKVEEGKEAGVKRAYSIIEATAVYPMSLESQLTDSAEVRLKRLNIFNELNLAFGTLDTVVPATKPKTVNKRREHFKKKHKYMNSQNNNGNKQKGQNPNAQHAKNNNGHQAKKAA